VLADGVSAAELVSAPVVGDVLGSSQLGERPAWCTPGAGTADRAADDLVGQAGELTPPDRRGELIEHSGGDLNGVGRCHLNGYPCMS
jgi:hypothetical protein